MEIDQQVVSWCAFAVAEEYERWLKISVSDEKCQPPVACLNLVVALRMWKTSVVPKEYASVQIKSRHCKWHCTSKNPVAQCIRVLANSLWTGEDAPFRPDVVTHTPVSIHLLPTASCGQCCQDQASCFHARCTVCPSLIPFQGPLLCGQQSPSTETYWRRGPDFAVSCPVHLTPVWHSVHCCGVVV